MQERHDDGTLTPMKTFDNADQALAAGRRALHKPHVTSVEIRKLKDHRKQKRKAQRKARRRQR
jgi:hypothetical protein